MTKEQLERLWDLYRERDELEARIDAIEDRPTMDIVYKSRDEIPHDKVMSRVMTSGAPAEKRALRMQLTHAKAQIGGQISEIEDWIAGIDDVRLRRLFRLRYISRLSWEDAADRLGFSVGHCMNIDSRFWKNCKNK
jgi:DNA-directed RNA polymerase specialized sigma24 family protein